MSYAAPFDFVGIANPLFQAIDQVTFSRTMQGIGYSFNVADAAFSILNFESHKIVIIPIFSLATGFSLALVPRLQLSLIMIEKR